VYLLFLVIHVSFYHICRTLDISADDCIFQDHHDRTGSTYQELLRLLPLCDEKALSVLVSTATALIRADSIPELERLSVTVCSNEK